MRLLIINGSPRKNGSTSKLITLVVDAARESGGQVEVRRHDLNDLAFKGCQGCRECKKETASGCIQVDDLTPVLNDMQECDAWVIGTPIYMGNMSGQLKMCVDRIYGFTGPNRTNRVRPGKRAVIAVTQGQQDVGLYRAVPEMLTFMLGRRGVTAEIVISGGDAGSTASGFGKEVEGRAAALGKWLVESR